MKTQNLTMKEYTEEDNEKAQKLAKILGYEQVAYTSSSAIWGWYCLPENPEHEPLMPHKGGVIISTAECGILFAQDVEDITGEYEL